MNIGILLLTHNDIGAQLLLAAKSTYGSIPFRTELLSIDHYDQPTDLINLAQQYVKVLDSGDGVLILTDMFGGTPSNLALSFLEQGKVEVLSGVNLPMLIKIGQLRDNTNLLEVAKEGKTAAQKYISIASEILSENDESQ